MNTKAEVNSSSGDRSDDNESVRQQTATNRQNYQRHILFFKSLLPTISTFDDKQILDFQSRVLSIVKEFRDEAHEDEERESIANHDVEAVSPMPALLFEDEVQVKFERDLDN